MGRLIPRKIRHIAAHARIASFAAPSVASIAITWAFACVTPPSRSATAIAGAEGEPPMRVTTPVFTYDVVRRFPHDRGAFTQGIVVRGGTLLESTGLYDESTLRRVDLETGRVEQRVSLAPELFAEGMALLRGKIYQLTWREHRAFVYDAETFTVERELSYDAEGWGLATYGEQLVASDGTDALRFIDPSTFRVTRVVRVHDGDRAVTQLNELELVRGEIFANIWGSDQVVRIAPDSGKVTGWIDFGGLFGPTAPRDPDDVMNGIAYDEANDRLFVTGKRWPWLFEVRVRR